MLPCMIHLTPQVLDPYPVIQAAFSASLLRSFVQLAALARVRWLPLASSLFTPTPVNPAASTNQCFGWIPAVSASKYGRVSMSRVVSPDFLANTCLALMVMGPSTPSNFPG
jgi:hypothetical protein